MHARPPNMLTELHTTPNPALWDHLPLAPWMKPRRRSAWTQYENRCDPNGGKLFHSCRTVLICTAREKREIKEFHCRTARPAAATRCLFFRSRAAHLFVKWYKWNDSKLFGTVKPVCSRFTSHMRCHLPKYPMIWRHASTANVQFMHGRVSKGGLISSPFHSFPRQETVSVNSSGALGCRRNSTFCTHLQDAKKLQTGRTGKEISRAELKKKKKRQDRLLWRNRGPRIREAYTSAVH